MAANHTDDVMTESDLSSYRNPNRLGEVLALIQVLAYDIYTDRSENGLKQEFQSKPLSSNSWTRLASGHPEFFRVRDDENKVKRASLVARYVLEASIPRDGKMLRPTLPSDVVNKLMEVAIGLRDREVQRADRWKQWIPIYVAVIGPAAAVVTAAIKVFMTTSSG